MKSKNKISILLAVAALIISTLACAFGEPALSNVRVAKDQDGTQVTSVFSPTILFMQSATFLMALLAM